MIRIKESLESTGKSKTGTFYAKNEKRKNKQKYIQSRHFKIWTFPGLSLVIFAGPETWDSVINYEDTDTIGIFNLSGYKFKSALVFLDLFLFYLLIGGDDNDDDNNNTDSS